MYKWLGVLLLSVCLLSIAPVKAQEFYESPYVILVETTRCTHSTGSYQTGFRVKEKPGIFTALHGVVDCDSIYTFSEGYQRLIPIEVDVDRDVIRLCAEKNVHTNSQTQQAECISTSLEEGFAPATETNIHQTDLKIVGHPAGSPGQYTLESIKAGKTSTDTLGTLVGPTLVKKLETRQSPLPTIRVIPLEGALAAGLSGAPVLTADDQLVGMGDGSQAEGLSWLIPWSELQLIPVQEAQARLDQLRALKPDEFFLSATTDQGENADAVIYRGVVKDSQNQSMPDAKVIVRLVDQFYRVYTVSDGEFLVRLLVGADSEPLSGTVTVEKEGYVTYTDNVDVQQGQVQEIHLDPTVRPRPTTLRRGGYVRIAVLEGAKYYQSYTTAVPIGLYAHNVVLAVVNGPEQSETSIWWQVRRLEEKSETAVWMPVVTGPTAYVEAIARLGRDECVSTMDRVPFYEEADLDADFVMVDTNTLLRVMSSRLVEKDDALWVQVERVDSAEQGWVEYAGTEGVNLQLDDNCGSARSSTPIDTPMSNLGPFLILEDGSQYTCKLAPPQNNAGSDSEAYSQQIVPTIMLTPELAIMATVDIQRLATSTVTVTPIPQPTTIIMLTPTPLPVSRNFCLAEVQESSGASKLDVVRVDPSSNAASTGISIKVGIKVRAVDVTKDKLWYLIQTESGSPIGWIPSTYLYFLECQN